MTYAKPFERRKSICQTKEGKIESIRGTLVKGIETEEMKLLFLGVAKG